MGLYESLSATATRLLNTYGRTWYLGEDSREVKALRVQRDAHRIPTGILNMAADPGAENGDIQFLLAASANPVYGERLAPVSGDETYIITSIDAIQPGGTVLAWMVKARVG